jgi:oligopeptide/dipeptide ABC transporter ATP-binding protein
MLNGIMGSVLMPLSRGSLWFTRRIPPCPTCRVPQQHMAGRWWKRVRRRRSLLSPPTPIAEALLRAIPMLGHKAERLHNIPGEPPNVARLPAGCPFHPRCPYVMPECRQAVPSLSEIEPQRWVACHLYPDKLHSPPSPTERGPG